MGASGINTLTSVLSPLYSIPSENTPMKRCGPLVHPSSYTAAIDKTGDRNFNLGSYCDADKR